MKKRFKIAIIILILILLISIFLTIYILAKQKKIFINKWFIDEENSIIGVDVSSYQGNIDMDELKKENVQFIYIKATEGSAHKDPQFAKNWENAKEANLLSGAYHFFSYDSSGKTQAENFINSMGADLRGRLLPAVDVEYYGDKEKNQPDKEDVLRELKIFLDTIENEYGVKPIIYTRSDIYEKYLKGELDEYKKWISSIYTPISWNYRDDWYIWQYLNRGELKGYTGDEKYIDLNVLNKDKKLDDLIIK